MARHLLLSLLVVVTAVGCPDRATPDAGSPSDAGTGRTDDGRADAGATDAGASDAGASDAGEEEPIDSGTSDGGGGVQDGGPADAGRADAGSSDAGPSDAGATEEVDGGSDGGSVDGGGADGGTDGGTDGGAVDALEALLAALRVDVEAALQAQSEAEGWPAPVDDGCLVVSTDDSLPLVAGDFDGWEGTPLTADIGFWWATVPCSPGDGYKLTNGTDYVADPWSRSYTYDLFGRISLVSPAAPHLERHFNVGDDNVTPRTVRVYLPAEPVTHVVYVHDGQNLFNPDADWGGWHLQEAAPAGMMVVGIDSTPARNDEYTHVADDVGGLIGGNGDSYADFVEGEVRALIDAHYGEPDRVAVMGSSLGGLISYHIALRHPGRYLFAASLSGTMGWGSKGLMNETMIERYAAAGHGSTALYLDSGGSVVTCVDIDGDGIEDDADDFDNYCVNRQLADVLRTGGYIDEVDLFYRWDADAPHNEAAWGGRVAVPLGIFADM